MIVLPVYKKDPAKKTGPKKKLCFHGDGGGNNEGKPS